MKKDGINKDALRKPALYIEDVKFSDGTTLTFSPDEIIVFVGPNNAGKSAALKELQTWIETSTPQKVVKSATLKKVGTAEELKSYLEGFAQKTGQPSKEYYAGIGFNIYGEHVKYFDNISHRNFVAPFFSTRLATETRITNSDPAGPIQLYHEPPAHPIHTLMADDKLAAKLNGLFKRAFNSELIVFRAGGSSFPLYVGKEPKKSAKEDALSRSYVDKLMSLAVPLQEQGDGMRSFATVLLYTLAAGDHSVQFLDEPEAFLHPPQARLLGEFIASERKASSQLLIATHSTDILEGLVSGGKKKVRIIRIQREGSINRVRELSSDKILAISNDTLTRYSGVFRGIFYRHVVIAESDSDCMFYNAVLSTEAVTPGYNPDVLFLHAAGKHRMERLVETLRSLDVPISVIADVDLMNEEDTVSRLYKALGGEWNLIRNNWMAVKKSIEESKPSLNSEQVKSLIIESLQDVSGIEAFPRSVERKVKQILRSISPWDAVKQSGRSAIRGAQAINHYDKLVTSFAQAGLWIVPVGELEGFCRGVEAAKGPAFVEKVLEERAIETDPELAAARTFVSAIWTRAEKLT